MASVTHAGRTVISNSTGGGCGWNFTPGIKPFMNLQPVAKARARRMMVKEIATEGASGTLMLTFLGTENEWESFREDIADLYDGSIGTLVVPGSGSYTNTCFTGVPGVSEQKAAEPNGSGTAQWTYEITMEILHL